jgi:hypothetical protein
MKLFYNIGQEMEYIYNISFGVLLFLTTGIVSILQLYMKMPHYANERKLGELTRILEHWSVLEYVTSLYWCGIDADIERLSY